MIKTLHPKIKALKERAAPINFRAVAVDASGKLVTESALDNDQLEGYAVIWGSKNDWGEIFVKGAFSKSIRERGPGSNSNYEIKMLWCHKQDDPLGLFEVLKEDETGLYFKTKKLDDVPSAKRALTQIRSGTINNFSIGWGYIWDKMEFDEEQDAIIVKEAELFEISPVSIPSEMNTFAIRSKENQEDLLDDTEDFIDLLPRKVRLEARHLFARYKSLVNVTEPLEQREQHSENNEPVVEEAIDYKYLIDNFKM